MKSANGHQLMYPDHTAKRAICLKCGLTDIVARNIGKGKHAWRCANQKKRKNRESLKRLRLQKSQRCRALTSAIKTATGCGLCSEQDPCCLDFHHLSDKTKAVEYLVSRGFKQRLLLEIAKCAVVCANCHRKIHAGKIPSDSLRLCVVDQQLVDEIFAADLPIV